MGFLGMSGKTWKTIGKYALKAAPIVAAPFTGGASLLALGAGTGALSGALDGGGWKGALTGGALGAIPGATGAGGAAKAGIKEIAKGVAKGTATNFATGTGTGLVTGQGLTKSLAGGGKGALSGLGTSGTGGVAQAAKTIGTNVALGAGSHYASNALQQAGVPKGIAGLGGNVFSNYLGNQFTGSAPAGNKFVAAGQPTGISSYLPQQTGGQGGVTSSGFWEKYGPLIAQGAGVGVGALAGQQATKMAQQRSPEELAALGGAQGTAGQMGRMGTQAFRQGQQYQQGPAAYFQTLLGGNRAAMAQAVAGPTAQITGNYRGAQRNLDQQGVRGAARDQAVTDLNRQRVSQIAGLTTGMQPYAAEQLAGMGNNMMAQAPGLLGNAGNIYGNLLTQGTANRTYARKEGGETGAAIGGLARDLGEVAFKKGAKPPATTDTKKTNGQATPPPQTAGASPAPAPAPAQGGALQPPPPTPGPGQLPFSTPGNLGVDFRTGVRKPTGTAYRPPVDFGLGQY